VNPIGGIVRRWIRTNGQTDLTFMPDINPLVPTLVPTAGVLVTEVPEEGQGRVTLIRTPNLYSDQPTSPLPRDACLGAVILADSGLDGSVRTILGVSVNQEDESVTCELVESLRELDASGQEISNLRGLEIFVRLNTLNLAANNIGNIAPLSCLERLVQLDLTNYSVSRLQPLSGLTGLR